MREALRLLVRSRINSYWIGWQLWNDRVLARQSPPANLAQVIIAPPCWNCSKPLSDVVLIDTLVGTYDLCKMTFQPGLLSLGNKYCQFHCRHRMPVRHRLSRLRHWLKTYLLPGEGTHFRPSDASLRSIVPAARVGVQEIPA